MDNKQRAVLLGLAVLAIVVGIVVASSGGGDEDAAPVIDTRTEAAQTTPAATPQPTTTTEAPKPKPMPDTTIVVRNGEPVEGVEELRYRKGGSIRFTVRSDVADNVHLHGYDVAKEIEAGGSVSFDVPATIEGKFELELEERAVAIAEIEVVP